MSQAFSCPNCGAPQAYAGGTAAAITCPYCDTTIIVPESLRTRAAPLTAGELERDINALLQIKRLVGEGKTLDAVELYRRTYNVSLDEARDAVEAVQRGSNVQMAQITISAPGAYQTDSGFGGVNIKPGADGSVEISVPEARAIQGRSLGCLVGVLVVFIIAISVVVPLLFGGVALFGANQVMQLNTPIAQVVATSYAPAGTTDAPTRIPSSPTSSYASVVSAFGEEGTGAGKFKDARSIALDNNGNVYVAEYTGGRLQVFDEQGKFKTQWLLDEKLPLIDIAASRNGTLFVLQGVDITRYDSQTGEALGKLPRPTSRSYDSIDLMLDGGLVAASGGANDELVWFDANGKEVLVVDGAVSSQIGEPELDPKIAVEGAGNIYVLGGFSEAVFVFDRKGKFINKFGGKGDEAGQFRAVQAIAVDPQGRVYVSDVKGIQVFDANGRYLGVFDIPRNVASGLAFDDAGNLWVAARTIVYRLQVNE